MVLFGGIMRRRAERRAAEAVAENNKKWHGWNQRRLAAEAEGHPFNELPPSAPASENKPEVS